MQSPTRVSRRGISNVKKTEENSKSQQADKERDIIPERLGVLSLCGGACGEMDDAGTKASGWIAEPVSFLFLHNILNWMIMMLEKLSLYFPFSTCVSLLLDELPPKCKTSRHGDQGISLSSEDMEVVMDSVGLSRNHEGEHLKEETASDDISSLFEEREPSLDEVKAAFHIFDENNDGYIDAGELQRVLLKLGFTEGLELDACMSMITIYDENHDGKIGFTDVTLVCSDPCKLACSLAQGQRQAVSLRSYMAHAESASTNSIPPVCFILCLDDPLVSLILFAVWKQQKQKQRDGDVRMVNVVSQQEKLFLFQALRRSKTASLGPMLCHCVFELLDLQPSPLSPVSTAALVFTSVLYRRILSCVGSHQFSLFYVFLSPKDGTANMTSGAVLAVRQPPFPFADPRHRRLQLHRRRLRLRWPTEVHLHSGDVPVGLDVLVVDGEDSILVRADLTLGGDRARLLCLGCR
ncbi:hypothetical protein BHM03_00009923 [Ensete ventricosum]|nr:hypothetical protein BHM03_00009923 [Ensete ventricosum]